MLFVALTKADSGECLGAFMSNQEAILTMVMATGKNLNDFGDPDACELNPLTDYALLHAKGVPIFVGLCLPAVCQGEDLQMVSDVVTGLAVDAGMDDLEFIVTFPNKEVAPITAGHIISFIGFSMICVCFVIGMFVEYTNLFGAIPNEGEDTSDSLKDKNLVNSKSTLGLFFLSFSPSRNFKKMFYAPQKDDDYLSVLNGIRVISTYFVVLGHTSSGNLIGGVYNILTAEELFGTWWAILAGIGYYSVDVFFFLSAFLASYLMISKFSNPSRCQEGRRTKCFNIPMVYLHRLIRVVPSILLFTVMMLTLAEFTGSGPIWYITLDNFFLEPCRKSWWTNIVFITSWYEGPECLGQLWYLADEMTFFLFVPFIVLAYINKKVIGYIIVVFLNVISIILPFIFSHIRGHSMTTINDPAGRYSKELYNHPYNRGGAYFVGVLFGIFYYEWNKSRTNPSYNFSLGARFYNFFKKNHLTCVVSFLVSSIVMMLLIIAPRLELHDLSKRHIPQIPSDFFNAFHRSVFVAALGFFLAPLFVGKLSLVRGFLGSKLWAPWAKVTFTAYLLHVLALAWVFAQSKGSLVATGPLTVFYSFPAFFATMIVGVPVSLIIESPILQLEKNILFPQKPKKSTLKLEDEPLNQNYEINPSEVTMSTSKLSHK
ncbi:unnamed protein product [Moneuplotes crassus]|uniref:Acyltransferase 3 domain-containing protein n=1 Tax=Euplotes crassus TaxID=5936 RepID=A0AAD1U474_EUPCR|nr:unnamed protein product [Moneuplotes crassus]